MATTTSSYSYRDGLKDGVPIALGYLFVSVGFGIAAVNGGLSALTAVIISMTNLTSAGQVAGLAVLRGGAVLLVSAVEMFVTQLVINIRYCLMGIALSQKLDSSFTLRNRLIGAFFITDEIFAVAVSKKGSVGIRYLLGLGTLPFFGWAAGTAIGAVAATVMPPQLSALFGVAIYGMFISIVVPDAKRSGGVLLCAAVAAALSCLFYFLPQLQGVGSGFATIICALLAAGLAAAVFPIKDEEEQK